MSCNLSSVIALRTAFVSQVEEVDLAIQIGMMCDALNGVPIAIPVNIPYFRAKVCCLAGYGDNQLRGIWTTLFAMLLNNSALGVAASNDVVYDGADPGIAPHAPRVFPPNQNFPSVAYSRTGVGSTFGWDPVSRTWN